MTDTIVVCLVVIVVTLCGVVWVTVAKKSNRAPLRTREENEIIENNDDVMDFLENKDAGAELIVPPERRIGIEEGEKVPAKREI